MDGCEVMGGEVMGDKMMGGEVTGGEVMFLLSDFDLFFLITYSVSEFGF